MLAKITEYVKISLLAQLLIAVFISAQWQGEEKIVPYQVQEERQPPMLLGDLATDARLDRKYSPTVFRSLNYAFLPSSAKHSKYFSLEKSSGILQTAESINRDELCPGQAECSLRMSVVVSPPQYFQIITIKVDILDINDNAPWFYKRTYQLNISEAAEPGVTFPFPVAEDLDGPENGVKRYEIVESSGTFGVRLAPGLPDSVAKDALLYLKKPLDRESRNSYSFQITALDGGFPPRSDVIQMTVLVQDANDNTPVFEKDIYNVRLSENARTGSVVLRVKARDADTGINSLVKYRFGTRTLNHYGHIFSVHNKTGVVTLKRPVDYETTQLYHLTVEAIDHGPEAKVGKCSVIVKVEDVNDNAPQIIVNTLTSHPEAEVNENAPIGTFVAYVSVTDKDVGPAGKVHCKIKKENKNFRLTDQGNGEFKLETNVTLDRETRDKYNISLVCTDRGRPVRTSTAYLTTTVLDQNDNPPVLRRRTFNFFVQENKPVGYVIRTIKAKDRDVGINSKIQYYLDFKEPDFAKYIRINKTTGELTALLSYDYETLKQFSCRIIAVDNGFPRFSTNATINVNVQDTNDNAPTFTTNLYKFNIQENQLGNTVVGRVKAKDLDSESYNKFTFALRPTSEHFDVHPLSGVISTKRSLDREEFPEHELTVVVTDSATPELQNAAEVRVHVTDVNDNPPVIKFPESNNNTVTVSSHTPKGYSVGQVWAHDPDAGSNALLTFKLSFVNYTEGAGIFIIEPMSGHIKAATNLAHLDKEAIRLQVVVHDNGTPLLSTSGTLVLNISSSIPFLYARSQGFMAQSTEHIAIIIGIIVGTALVIAAFIVAIILMRRRNDSKEGSTYNCRTAAAHKLLNGKSVLKVPIPPAAPNGPVQKTFEEVQEPIEDSGTKHYVQVQHFLDMYNKDQDGDSSGSGDLSITDSGRGPSEEGESMENGHSEWKGRVSKPSGQMIPEEQTTYRPTSEPVDYTLYGDHVHAVYDITPYGHGAHAHEPHTVDTDCEIYKPPSPFRGEDYSHHTATQGNGIMFRREPCRRNSKKKKVRISDNVTEMGHAVPAGLDSSSDGSSSTSGSYRPGHVEYVTFDVNCPSLVESDI